VSRLTIGERIVLHLSRYDILNDDPYNIPWDLTQDGIAASLRISRAHSSIELKKLREADKVEERQTHIKGGKIKRKSYTLTPSGREDAKRLMEFAEKEGIDIMPMLDMKRCDPQTLLDSVDEEDRDVLGVACVLRCSVPRSELPETAKPVIPVDVNGMVVLSDTVKNNIISVAGEDLIQKWHSAAADHWLDKDDAQERLYHLVYSGRITDACKLVMNDSEKLTNNINDDLFDILARMDVPDRYLTGVLPVKITVALESGDTDRAEALVTALMAKDNEIGLLYSADIEMKNGNHAKALEMVNSLKDNDRFEVKLRRAEALWHLDDEAGAMSILEEMKRKAVSSGTVDGIDRIYIQMSAISAVSGKHDSSVGYLLKALNVTTEDGKKRIYGLLATAYDDLGMTEKAKDCRIRSR